MRSKSRKSQKRRKNSNHDYGTLEDRKLLATIVNVNPAEGFLVVDLEANNDIAVIGIADNGNVTINGNQDLNTSAAGVQTLAADDLLHVTFEGNRLRTGQIVSFNAEFSGQRQLSTLKIEDVGQVSINDRLEVRANLDIFLSGTGGRIGDAINGQLIVGDVATINAGANEIGLNNAGNDFNRLNLTTTGTNNDVVLNDVDGVELTGVNVSGDLTLTAGGVVQDANSTTIEVLGTARFTGSEIELGDHVGDTTNFFRSSYTATGHVDVQEDSNTILTSTDVGSLTLRSVGGIFDGTRTSINVDGLAQFFGNNRVRIGEGGLDTFNAGSVQFQSNGHVHITENSDAQITGENRASSLTFRSWGNVTDAADTSINVSHETGFEALGVELGDSPTDVFNSGSLSFFVRDRFAVTEDSNSHIIETKNRAAEFYLESAGAITDADDAFITVDNLAEFKANSVNVGDTQIDQFNAGSVRFDTSGRFKITENSGLTFTGDSSAANSVVNSSGNITNQANATVNVRNSAAFFANNVILGNQSGDEFNAGTVAFRTAPDTNGLVAINEDSNTQLGGISEAGRLRLEANGNITDGPGSQVNIDGNSTLTTLNNGRIKLGDSGVRADNTPFDSVFETLSLTVQTDGSGNAIIEEDGDILLTGINRANSLSLIADGGEGRVLDAIDARIDVNFNLNVEAGSINLGNAIIANASSTDRLAFRSLTFQSAGNVNVSADNSFFLTGSSNSGGFLTLESEGDIRTTGGSELVTQTGAQFDGMDIFVGNLSNDCFDILDTNSDGSVRLRVNGAGAEDVQLGCNV